MLSTTVGASSILLIGAWWKLETHQAGLSVINHEVIPRNRLISQMNGDIELFAREGERFSSRGRKPPVWLRDVIQGEIKKLDLLRAGKPLPQDEQTARLLKNVRLFTDQVFAMDWTDAELVKRKLDEWRDTSREFLFESDRGLRLRFEELSVELESARHWMQFALAVVFASWVLVFALLLARVSRLEALTKLARGVSQDGSITSDHRRRLAREGVSGGDEISILFREVHAMATQLLERERTVLSQKERLSELMSLNQYTLNSFQIGVVTLNLFEQIQSINQYAIQVGLVDSSRVVGSQLLDWPKLFHLSEIGLHEIGGRVWESRREPLKNNHGELIGALLLFEDVTDRVELEAKVRNVENLAVAGRLSAQVAHEIRNPLHSIGLEAELAVEHVKSLNAPEVNATQKSLLINETQTGLRSILESVERLHGVTENYLKLSRGGISQNSSFSLMECLERVLATYSPSFSELGVNVDWSVASSDLDQVMGDRNATEQALGNLVRNSLDAMAHTAQGSRKLRIRIQSASDPSCVDLILEDSGPGISPDVRHKVFEPFITTKAKGTGLGLSFGKRVLEEQGGSLKLLPSKPLEGASFELRFRKAMLRSEQELAPQETIL